MISAVIPTIKSRSALLQQTVDSLTGDVEVIVVEDAPTIGEAWNEGAREATGSHLWLGADDVTLCEGWMEAAVEKVAEGVYPTPRIIRPDGSVEACGTLGQGGLIAHEVETGFPCGSSQFPFMSMEMWEEIGPSLPIHYYADDYLGFRAKVAGYRVELVRDYTLIHYEGTAGRAKMVARAMTDRQRFLQTISEEHSCLVAS